MSLVRTVAKKMYASSIEMSRWRNCVGHIDAKVMKNVAKAKHMYLESYQGDKVCVHTSHRDLHVTLILFDMKAHVHCGKCQGFLVYMLAHQACPLQCV